MSTPKANEVDKWQEKRQKMFRAVPTIGKTVNYLGKRIFVYRNTFWPFCDSLPLVENMVIKPTDCVLDIGTGSGVIALLACYKGALRVVAVDINPWAVKSARRNAKEHGFSKIMKVVQGDLFASLTDEKFDVITANLPFRDKTAHDLVAQSQWDTGFATNRAFLHGVKKYLANDGRIYFAHSNFGSISGIRRLAKSENFSVRKIGETKMSSSSSEIFYAFVLTVNKKSE